MGSLLEYSCPAGSDSCRVGYLSIVSSDFRIVNSQSPSPKHIITSMPGSTAGATVSRADADDDSEDIQQDSHATTAQERLDLKALERLYAKSRVL